MELLTPGILEFLAKGGALSILGLLCVYMLTIINRQSKDYKDNIIELFDKTQKILEDKNEQINGLIEGQQKQIEVIRLLESNQKECGYRLERINETMIKCDKPCLHNKK